MPKKETSSSPNSIPDEIPDEPWVDPDDAPELTEELLESVVDTIVYSHGDKVIARGRPALDMLLKKTTVTMRLDPDVLASYKSLGTGWQTKINEDLRKARKLGPRRKTA